MSFFDSLFGTKQGRATEAKTALELVTNAAGLASNTDEIDPMLDRVRSITAGLAEGQEPSPADSKVLIGVYLQVERYLTTKEPIRTFTKQELRARVAPELRSQIEAYETNNKGS